jgi:hypothetical protein
VPAERGWRLCRPLSGSLDCLPLRHRRAPPIVTR